MKNIYQGHTCDLIHETSTKRIWKSRMRIEDGAKCNDEIIVEKLIDGKWVVVS